MVIGALGKSGRGATEIAERWGYTFDAHYSLT